MKRTILCIDDIKTNLFTVESVIDDFANELYDVVLCTSADDGLSVLLKQKVDLILLDVMMPTMDGFEAAKMIKSNKKTKKIPIIFLTAKKDDETIESCFTLGDDYISKPFNHVELLARIAFHIRLSEKELEVKKKEEELTIEANYDSLTKIYNRKMFHTAMCEKIDKASVSQKAFVFILLDIDYFKKVNDVHGHLVGDAVLINLAKVIKVHIRESDIFARWGGEEFVLSFDVDVKRGFEIAEHLRKNIQEADFGSAGTITCSFGITQYIVDDTVDMITARADKALYESKHSGRNKVCIA